jgi:ESCRT-II complex subunit
VNEEKAAWLDKNQTVCLVTVQSLQQWADKIVSVVKTRFSSNIMTVDEIYSGEDARGTGAALQRL